MMIGMNVNTTDNRYKVFKERLSALTREEIQRIIDNIELVCLDTFNYDVTSGKFCPLAIGMNLHKTIDTPSDINVAFEISKRFNPVNALKGVQGQFYTTNRKEDLLNVCKEVLNMNSRALTPEEAFARIVKFYGKSLAVAAD